MEALKLLRKSRKLCRKKDVFIRVLLSRSTGVLKIYGFNPVGFPL